MERIVMKSQALQREFRSLKEIRERRDMFAAAALTGLLATRYNTFDSRDVVDTAWGLADMMLER